MKIGMVFECTRDGPDIKVCKEFARMLMPGCAIDAVPMTSKKRLRTECGPEVAALLASGCDRVLIIWDLYPAWGEDSEGPPLRDRDRELINASLAASNVPTNKAHLICINAMLETWLLVDDQAIKHVIEEKRRQAIGRFTGPGNREGYPKPKQLLESLFQKHGCRIYAHHVDAILIARKMTAEDRWEANKRRLRKLCSFKRFAERLTGAPFT